MTSTTSLASHSSATTLSALSDLYRLYSSSQATKSSLIKRASSKADSATAQKLLFYIAVIRSSESGSLRKLANRVAEESKKRLQEIAERSAGRASIERLDLNTQSEKDLSYKGGARIVELE